jgi:phage-related protein
MVKELYFAGSSREDIRVFPEEVRLDIGYALYAAQIGEKFGVVKPLKGFGGAGVLEIIKRFDGSTYRTVYAIKFPNAVYVLHCFQKKAKHGVKTPQQDMDLIKQRLKTAEENYKTYYK